MQNCVQSMIEFFPGNFQEKATMPAVAQSLKADPNEKKLDEKRAKEFHNIAARKLFVSE